jgi:hypothetical protein
VHFLLKNLQAAQGDEAVLEPEAEAEEEVEEEAAISLQYILFPWNIHAYKHTESI